MASLSLKIIIVLIGCIRFISTSKILAVCPNPSFSHQVVFRALTTELARRGHHVTVVTTDPVDDLASRGIPPENYRQIDVHDISYKIVSDNFNFAKMRESSTDPKNIYPMFKDAWVKLVDVQMQQSEMQTILQNQTEQFDLLILESLVRPSYGLIWRFKAPLIAFSSLSGLLTNFDVMGSPTHPVLYPDLFRHRAGKLGIWDKIYTVYCDLFIRYHDYAFDEMENAVARKYFGEDMPPLSELEARTDLLFLNVHPVLAGIRPVVPGIVYLGGMHMKLRKELPEDLQMFLDESPQGVVYMSLGTNVMSKDLPPDVLRMMLEVFEALPYRVLWKYEEELPDSRRPSNLRVAEWLPQADLLGHPNIKAFITQGGQQSMEEAIRDHVPLVGIPFFADQDYNVQNFKLHGIGIGLDMSTFNKDDFMNAIMTVATVPKYKENMARLSEILSDQPTSSLERAVWWTEYVLRHRGAAHLRAPAAGLPLREYFVLDVVAVVAAAAAAAALLLACIVRGVWRTLRGVDSKKKLS